MSSRTQDGAFDCRKTERQTPSKIRSVVRGVKQNRVLNIRNGISKARAI